MAITTYTPGTNNIVHKTKVDFAKPIITKPVNIVQYDAILPVIEVALYFNDEPYVIPNDASISANVRWSKNTITDTVENPVDGCNAARNTLFFKIDPRMTLLPGCYYPIIELVTEDQTELGQDGRLGSSKMIFNVERNPIKQTEEGV